MNFQASGMEAFEYSALPARVIFGFGTLPRAAGELLALDRKLSLSTHRDFALEQLAPLAIHRRR